MRGAIKLAIVAKIVRHCIGKNIIKTNAKIFKVFIVMNDEERRRNFMLAFQGKHVTS